MQSIIAQHAEEAAFLWHHRQRAAGEPHYTLADLVRLDERLEAHLDGVRVAGDAGWEACRANLKEREQGEFFAAGHAAFESEEALRIHSVLTASATVRGGPQAIASALGWMALERARPHLDKLFSSPDPNSRRVAVAGWAIHRHDPGTPLVAATRDSDPRVLARAVRALGELGRADLSVMAASRMRHEDPSVRFAAAWSASLLGKYPNAVAALQTIATTDPVRASRATDLAMRRLDPRSGSAWVEHLPPRLAVIGSGAAGDPSLVPALLARMKDPKLARVAGEAFSLITGADLADLGLEGRKPEGFEAGPNDDPADENVEMDPDDNLPWPDPPAVENWWRNRAGAFKPGLRHLMGKPIEPAWLRNVLRDGRQRQRAAAALELAILEPGKPLFEVRAPGFRQQRSLPA